MYNVRQNILFIFISFAMIVFSCQVINGYKIPESDYLTFTAQKAGSTVSFKPSNGTAYYSKNNADWSSVNKTNGITVTLDNIGDYVKFKGSNVTTQYSDQKHFSITGEVNASGYVDSLRMYGDGLTTGLADGCYESMFYGCEGLLTPPMLGEETLTKSCYSNMFNGCTNLKSAPALPAKKLEQTCYNSMFSGCISLTEAPELSATELADSCYSGMFKGCVNLSKIHDLPATQLQNSCYSGMFDGCEKLTYCPELPATNLADKCYSGMFNGCKGLTSCPELPARELKSQSYYRMFKNCSGIKYLPKISAETVADRCYYQMFGNDSGLNMNLELSFSPSSDYKYPMLLYVGEDDTSRYKYMFDNSVISLSEDNRNNGYITLYSKFPLTIYPFPLKNNIGVNGNLKSEDILYVSGEKLSCELKWKDLDGNERYINNPFINEEGYVTLNKEGIPVASSRKFNFDVENGKINISDITFYTDSPNTYAPQNAATPLTLNASVTPGIYTLLLTLTT